MPLPPPGGLPDFVVALGESALLVSRGSGRADRLVQRIELVASGNRPCPRLTVRRTAQARFDRYVETALVSTSDVYVVVDGVCSGEDCTPPRKLVRLDPRTLARRDDQLLPDAAYQQGTGIVYGAGSLWVTTRRGVARIELPSLRLRAEVELPGTTASKLVFAGGAVWASDQFGGRLARISTGGAVRTFPVAARGAGQVRGLAASGGSLWVSVGY